MTRPGFDDLVRTSVQEAMSRMLGGEVWKAISFYFDVRTLTKEPQVFEKLMNNLLGASSKDLQQTIGETLLSKVGSGSEKARGQGLQDLIQMARARFLSMTNLTAPRR